MLILLLTLLLSGALSYTSEVSGGVVGDSLLISLFWVEGTLSAFLSSSYSFNYFILISDITSKISLALVVLLLELALLL